MACRSVTVLAYTDGLVDTPPNFRCVVGSGLLVNRLRITLIDFAIDHVHHFANVLTVGWLRDRQENSSSDGYYRWLRLAAHKN